MHHRSFRRVLALASVAALCAGGLVACGGGGGSNTSTGSTSGGSASGGPSGTVALLLPENKTARYEAADRPLFTRALSRYCPNCKLIYSNAQQDAAKQQSQAEAAITNGARVIVLDPVDAKAAAAIVTRAKQSGIGVVSYDRLVQNANVDYYISFDNRTVGELQARTLVAKLRSDGRSGSLVMINGAPTDPNAAQFKAGALSVLNTSGYRIAKQYDTPDWSPDQAQTEMDQATSALGRSGFVGVYAANDGTAGGAIASMKSNGITPSTRPTTGQDAELAGIQRIVIGDQYMTVYKAYKPEATDAARLAVALLEGQKTSSLANRQVNNGSKTVSAVILTPVAVTQRNIATTVVRDGLYTVRQICTSAYASGCRRIGLTTAQGG